MRGKVKYVTRSIWYEENQSDHWRSDVHPVRYTNTYAVLYNGDEVDIDEDDIRDYYDRSRITMCGSSTMKTRMAIIVLMANCQTTFKLSDYI